MERQLNGRHVLAIFGTAFAVIIGVNLTLAYQAVHTFPGLEVKNSYVASQNFDQDRAAQESLGWKVGATLTGDRLVLRIDGADGPVQPKILSATFGRATNVGQDHTPLFVHDGDAFVADLHAEPGGNWNLRLVAEAADGRLFRQRIIVSTAR